MCYPQYLLKVICSPFLDSQDMSKDTQKKSKRKGRNKQEVMTVSQTEPEPEAVKTPIDLMRVSTRQPKHLFSYCLLAYLLYEGNSHGLSTKMSQHKLI